MALRSLHHAAECLHIYREQEEALKIFIRIHKETGWRIGFIPKDLMDKWGWDPDVAKTVASEPLPTNDDPSNHYMNTQFINGLGGRSQYSGAMFDQYAENKRLQADAQRGSIAMQGGRPGVSPAGSGVQQQQPSKGVTPPQKKPPAGIVNPMFGNADFNAPKHPYQDHYVAPVQQHGQGSMGLGLQMMQGGVGMGYARNDYQAHGGEHGREQQSAGGYHQY